MTGAPIVALPAPAGVANLVSEDGTVVLTRPRGNSRLVDLSVSVALNAGAGALLAPLTVPPNVETVVLTTDPLSVGRWLILASVDLSKPPVSTGAEAEVSIRVGSATATFEGAQSAVTAIPVNGSQSVTLACLVTVTVAGTLEVVAFTTVGFGVLTANPSTAHYPGATGYTSTKIA